MEAFESAGDVRIQVLTASGQSLNFASLGLKPTEDWRRVDITFNSLENSEVNLYLGVWGGRGGKIWWDDVRVEPGGWVNLIRRDGAPLKITSEDGLTTYVEGKDFDKAQDPLMGTKPWTGEYTVWHEPPAVTVTPGGRLKPDLKVLASYYHTAVIYDGQVPCCMSEPKVYQIIEWQIAQVREHLQPDGYFMQHDEIRIQGWDESCRKRNLTCGQILADNVRRCAEIIRRTDPGKTIYVWSDMFDPFHNAGKEGWYYLARGKGPWYGSWEGLDKDIVIVNWHGHQPGRVESLRHFAQLGHRQILAGYYDGPVESIDSWLHDAAGVPGVMGVMYTTWRGDYGKLEAFAERLLK